MILLPLLAAPADPFGLKTPWAAAFAPVAADRYVVRDVATLRTSMGRGGHIRLAAGTYDIGALTCIVYKPTVVEGAGKGATVIQIGAQYTAPDSKVPGDDYGLRVFSDTIGFKNLTIRNASRASAPNGIMRGGPSGHANQRIFLDGVRIEEGNGLAVYFDGIYDALFRDCEFSSTSSSDGPLRIAGTARLRLEGNRFRWRANRVGVLFAQDTDIVGNTFVFDSKARSHAESGFLELSFASNVRFWDNRLGTTGRAPFAQNDMEGIMTQMSNVGEYQGDGKVVAAKETALATTMRWGADPWLSPAHPPTTRKAVYLLSGKGAGQWRWAAPGADGTVNVDRAWAIPPAKGDRVSIGSVNAYRLDVRRNRVEGSNVGIELYDGGLDCTIVDNAILDGGGIMLRSPSIHSGRTARSTNDHFPLWNVVAKRNRIENANGVRPASFDVYSTDIGNTDLPMPFYGVFVQGNTIVGRNQTFGGEVQGQDGLLVGWNGTARAVAPSRRGGVTATGNVLKGAAIYVDHRKAESVTDRP